MSEIQQTLSTDFLKNGVPQFEHFMWQLTQVIKAYPPFEYEKKKVVIGTVSVVFDPNEDDARFDINVVHRIETTDHDVREEILNGVTEHFAECLTEVYGKDIVGDVYDSAFGLGNYNVLVGCEEWPYN